MKHFVDKRPGVHNPDRIEGGWPRGRCRGPAARRGARGPGGSHVAEEGGGPAAGANLLEII